MPVVVNGYGPEAAAFFNAALQLLLDLRLLLVVTIIAGLLVGGAAAFAVVFGRH